MPRLVAFVLVLAALVGLAVPAAADDRATCFDAKSESEAAIKACDRLIASGEHNASIHLWRGNAYSRKGDYDRAIADYTEAIRLDPKFVIAYFNRGIAHNSKGDSDRAIADASEAIRLDPKYALAYYNRGLAYHRKGDSDRAIADYTEAIRLDPKFVTAYNNRGIAHNSKGDSDRAIADYTEAIRLDPKYALAYYNRAVAHERKGDYDRAIADASEAIRLDSKYALAYLNRGVSYYNKGASDRAIADASEAIRLDPKLARAYNNRGFAYISKGEYDRAIADLTEAIGLDPKYANAYANRGEAFRNKGDLDRALADLEAAIKIDPKNRYAYVYRGLLHEDKGERERARADYHAALALPVEGPSQKAAHEIARQRLAALAASSPSTPFAQLSEIACRGDGTRVALLIGNQNYVGTMQPLDNPRRDIAAFGALLCRHGFTVFRHADLDVASFDTTVESFARAARGTKTALVYYSGHGFAVGRRNWLVPVDARLGCEDISGDGSDVTRLKRRLIDLDEDVLSRLDGAGDQIVILDACRTDPVKGCRGGATPSLVKGLVRASASSARLIVYATQDGQVALDRIRGSDTSPLIAAMLKRLPDNARRDWLTAMAEVSREVFALTDRKQRPNIDFSLAPQGCLAPECGAPAQPIQIAPSEAAQAWSIIQTTTSLAVLEDFIRQFGNTPYGSMARARLEELKKSQVAVGVPAERPAQPPAGVRTLSTAQERALKPKDSFKECDACPEMVVVPAGSFTMGSPASEEERLDDEGPQRQVTFAQPFAVGKFAVTFEQFAAFVQETGHDTGSECVTYEDDKREKRSGRSWRNPGFAQSGSHPAVCIDWNDAKAYVAWLSRKTGKTYRLLAEAEREYVTRAGTTTPFWWGSSISTSQANYAGNSTYGGGSKGEWRKRTMPVESFLPNPWGLYQVHGNVWDWVEDCWNESYKGAPADGSAWTSGDCKSPVLRGGSLGSWAGGLRSAQRDRGPAGGRDSDVALRVARTLLNP